VTAWIFRRAIATARSLGQELGIAADFICSDLYDLPNVLAGEFDIVFTSYGVLCWLPDLARWAQVIAHFLKPGGTFYIVEEHPLANILRMTRQRAVSRLPIRIFIRRSHCSGTAKAPMPTERNRRHRTTFEWRTVCPTFSTR